MTAKYIVPDGMLQAGRAVYSGYVTAEKGAQIILEAALLWLSENPIVPTREQYDELHKKWHYDELTKDSSAIEFQRICHAWQRRMFLAPEVPEHISIEADMLHNAIMHKKAGDAIDLIAKSLLEAFRRGQENPKQ